MQFSRHLGVAVSSMIWILFAVQPGMAQFEPPAAQNVLTLQAQFTHTPNESSGQLFVTATIKPGWHIYSITQPEGGPLATTVQLKLPQGVRQLAPFQALVAPHLGKEPEAFGDLPIETHEGSITWQAPLEFTKGIDPSTLEIRGVVRSQACDASSCIPPQETPFLAKPGHGITASSPKASPIALSSEKTVSKPEPHATATTDETSFDLFEFLTKIGSAFLGGLILNFMPCVLPVISLKLLSFFEQAGERRSHIFWLNVWYSIGLLTVFMVLAALAASARLAWGEQFTLPWFKVTMTAFVFVMALSFLGVWEIPIPGFVGVGHANELQAQEGPSGAFFKGIFTTILATPCSGPFLGPVFGYLLKQPPYMAYCIFGAVGLGMASPYLVIGAFPHLIRSLPKPGAWMETVKQLMGFLLLGTVVYLFSTLSAAYFVPTLTLLIGLWFACWWIGRTPLTAAAWKRHAAWIGGGSVAILAGLFAFIILLHVPKIAWQPFSPQALEQARAEGKTVMLDFSADWCPTCKMNLKFAIETDAVKNLIEANGVVPMLADWTDHSPVIKKTLNDLGRNSIPVLVIWSGRSANEKPIVLSDLLTKGDVLEALQKAGPSKNFADQAAELAE